MHPSDFPRYWRKTRLLALITVLVVLVAGAGLPMLVPESTTATVLEFPLAYFVAAHVSLVLIFAVLIWLVQAQRRVEQQFDVVHEE